MRAPLLVAALDLPILTLALAIAFYLGTFQIPLSSTYNTQLLGLSNILFLDKSVNAHHTQHEDLDFKDSTPLLFLRILLASLVAVGPYIFEYRQTFPLPKASAAEWDGNSEPYPYKTPRYYRKHALFIPTMVCRLLSVLSIVLVCLHNDELLVTDPCNTLNPDIAGLGTRIGLWVPGVVVILTSALGHFHVQATEIKSINLTLSISQVVYGVNLCFRANTSADRVVGAIVLDCLALFGSMMFSMKECLSARLIV